MSETVVITEELFDSFRYLLTHGECYLHARSIEGAKRIVYRRQQLESALQEVRSNLGTGVVGRNPGGEGEANG